MAWFLCPALDILIIGNIAILPAVGGGTSLLRCYQLSHVTSSHGIFMDEEHILGMLINEEPLFLQTVSQNEDLKRDFSGSPVVKTPSLHCRKHGFDPWSGNENPTCHKARKKKERERDEEKTRAQPEAWGPSWLTQPRPASISQTTGYTWTDETEIDAYCYKLLGFWDG